MLTHSRKSSQTAFTWCGQEERRMVGTDRVEIRKKEGKVSLKELTQRKKLLRESTLKTVAREAEVEKQIRYKIEESKTKVCFSFGNYHQLSKNQNMAVVQKQQKINFHFAPSFHKNEPIYCHQHRPSNLTPLIIPKMEKNASTKNHSSEKDNSFVTVEDLSSPVSSTASPTFNFAFLKKQSEGKAKIQLKSTVDYEDAIVMKPVEFDSPQPAQAKSHNKEYESDIHETNTSLPEFDSGLKLKKFAKGSLFMNIRKTCTLSSGDDEQQGSECSEVVQNYQSLLSKIQENRLQNDSRDDEHSEIQEI